MRNWQRWVGADLGNAGDQIRNRFCMDTESNRRLKQRRRKDCDVILLPTGVSGTEPQFYLYISGTGTAEAVLVTGGTCAGNGQPGTLQFTTANPHTAGYTVGSASAGLQEALVAARFTPSNPAGSSQSGKVIMPPGELKAFARVSIRASNLTVDFSGSIVECWMNDTCIYVGDPAASQQFEDITLINPRGRPTVAGGTKPFIEVNAQKTRLLNVAARVRHSPAARSAHTFRLMTIRLFCLTVWIMCWAPAFVVTARSAAQSSPRRVLSMCFQQSDG